eukprot:CAMPEP_0115130142 /NCGR_PEP_ID=MMETSP0227-20121206/52274_1 /TAXON_ID=89957 /ORGANISM="Polarella glacialis, Strain CCMP 1383" /LENGTH=630 /DNA_ID=CAMNT_0002535273 /DNA_START=85 /DNA_END=1978 /DNA_ORIENTATION=+
MPPTAWALSSEWSQIWDAPRFRGDGRVQKLALSREALGPLLKIAASCVAVLLPHVQGKEGAVVPPHGASRELLVAAVDGDPAGAALSDPTGDPAGWVRALAKSAFQTGDGDFIEGLSEASLDQLLDQHCSGQLEQAALLVRDPSAALQSALEAAREAVKQVVAKPPKAGDLAAVADRLLLVQQLERLVKDATAVAASEASESSGSSEAPETTPPTANPGHYVTEAGTDPEDQPPLKRTKSQIATTLKVQRVKQHQDDLSKEILDLRRTASALAQRDVPEGEAEKLKAELDAVDTARKRAVNFGEDLVEDLLLLDNLSGLSPEDRSTRKATISGIEGLLQDLDSAKSRLAGLHNQLEGKLKGVEVQHAAEEAAQEKARRAERAEKAAAALPRLPPTTQEGREAAKTALEPPPPGKEVWSQVRLPLRFHSSEEPDQYTILATVPGLDLEELKLELGDEQGSTLQVQGLRVPSPQEAASMRRKIALKIQQIAKNSPEQFSRLCVSISQVAADGYLELGQGEFGRFSETFRMPEDVDVDGIDASYRDGVLRIVLPKLLRAPQATQELSDPDTSRLATAGPQAASWVHAGPTDPLGSVVLELPRGAARCLVAMTTSTGGHRDEVGGVGAVLALLT